MPIAEQLEYYWSTSLAPSSGHSESLSPATYWIESAVSMVLWGQSCPDNPHASQLKTLAASVILGFQVCYTRNLLVVMGNLLEKIKVVQSSNARSIKGTALHPAKVHVTPAAVLRFRFIYLPFVYFPKCMRNAQCIIRLHSWALNTAQEVTLPCSRLYCMHIQK